jgi:hypothetical protein
MSRWIPFLALATSVLSLACASTSAPPPAPEAPPSDGPAVLLGEVTREAIETALPNWVEAQVAAEIDPAAVQALQAVPPGAEVYLYLGTWCSDSRRELGRFWRAQDEAAGLGGSFPFGVHLIGVDRSKTQPAALLAGVDVRYVPTIVVKRGGGEVGRIIEHSVQGIERDLLELLTGRAKGVLTSSRPELASPAAQP